MNQPFTVIIPARFKSTRLPGKLLLDIAGKPVIQRVYEQAKKSHATQIIVATDDERIAEVIKNIGGQVCMTSTEHNTGSDRLGEAVQHLALKEDEIVVNVQGDEPLINPKHIDLVAKNLTLHTAAVMTTLCEPMDDYLEISNPNRVKVVLDKNGYALYFSRAPIPWDQQNFSKERFAGKSPNHYRHIGLYAYRTDFLNQYLSWPRCPLEELENIEQVRVLWEGYKVHVAIATEKTFPGIDTKEDLMSVRQLFDINSEMKI